ncbi:MAG: hypothetical protein HOJ35_07795, partial [Bdellovibrionales bacterium]|nr:hypothetical protein [Bdellovibrionales bacterium]
FIDPYLGYNAGWAVQDKTVSGVTAELDFTSTGPMFGARAGFQMLGFMAGAEYGMSTTTQDLAAATTIGESAASTDLQTTYMGVFVGYELPILLRAWATYNLSVDSEVTSDSGKGNVTSGSGFTLGVGFTGLPFVSLNVEYRSITFDKSTASGGSETDLTNDITSNELFASVSIPLP